MKYRKSYIATRDIDWFCRIKNCWIHVASAGGFLPLRVNDIESNRLIQSVIRRKHGKVESNEDWLFFDDNQIIYNENYIHDLMEADYKIVSDSIEMDKETYIKKFSKSYKETFGYMAMKGLLSFDRTELDYETKKFCLNDGYYVWIACPKNSNGEFPSFEELNKIQGQLDEKMKNDLGQTYNHFDYGSNVNLDLQQIHRVDGGNVRNKWTAFPLIHILDQQ